MVSRNGGGSSVTLKVTCPHSSQHTELVLFFVFKMGAEVEGRAKHDLPRALCPPLSDLLKPLPVYCFHRNNLGMRPAGSLVEGGPVWGVWSGCKAGWGDHWNGCAPLAHRLFFIARHAQPSLLNRCYFIIKAFFFFCFEKTNRREKTTSTLEPPEKRPVLVSSP